MDIIRREGYLERIKRLIGRETIVLLTGQRRVGKSYILKSVAEEMSQMPGSNII